MDTSYLDRRLPLVFAARRGMLPGTMRIAALQLNSQDDVAHNLARVRALAAEAAAAGAEVVALPENFAFMGDEGQKRAIAERVEDGAGGPILSAVVEIAGRHGVHVIAGGMPEASGDPHRPFNTSVLVGPSGHVLARYRKIHLFDVSLLDGTELRESAATSAGDAVVTADVGGIRLGMTVCYDLRFPELYRRLTGAGSRVVTVPAAFTLTTGKDHWAVLLRARAIENQIYVVAPAQHGRHPRGRQTYGKTLIVDPWGEIIAQASEGEGFALARLDLAYLDRVRTAVPCLQHRKLE